MNWIARSISLVRITGAELIIFRRRRTLIWAAVALMMAALVILPIFLNSALPYCGISRASAQNSPCQEDEATIQFQSTQIAALAAANAGLQTLAAQSGASSYVPFVVTVQVPVTITIAPIQLEIISVRHPGDLNREVIVLHNIGRTVNLEGWRLRSSSGFELVLPVARLETNHTLLIHSEAGTGTATNIYLGQHRAHWFPGDQIALTDPDGNIQASFDINI
jgi:hypothetical protein